jgi:hypothetical protein
MAQKNDQSLVSYHPLRHFARNLRGKKVARQEIRFNQKAVH